MPTPTNPADKYASFRFPNGRGGHDLTPEGWAEMVRLQEQHLEATRECARLLATKPRESVDFKQAHRRWQQTLGEMLALTGAGTLFDVATFNKGRN